MATFSGRVGKERKSLEGVVASDGPLEDFIDDRALRSAEQDRFGHGDFATLVAKTVSRIPTPANIAVFAPWGSGKTSLANLIQAALTGTKARFVYFDAFKYAEAPLRREFLAQVARQLQEESEDYGRGLYEARTRSVLSLPRSQVTKLIRLFVLTFLFLGGMVAVVTLGLAALRGGPFWASWARLLGSGLALAFGATPILGTILGIVGKQFVVQQTRYAPSSDEEFEHLFQALVEKTLKGDKSHDRLVIFIDELDRCSSDEVASTLETLRTFLEVQDCVFIVAADRQVLETAVARRARQETPLDVRNPYYSSGGAYLDKIFQYQWQLPPLLPRRLSIFARELVKERGGVWQEVENVSEVVSVLVPTHIQSPRRVKELLNSFAMTYRVAQRRSAQGLIDGDPRDRAAELAKLVCLQVEFPIFAADLPNDSRLPELVLLQSRGESSPSGVRGEIWERAGAYARGEVDLDLIISRGHEEPSQVRRQALPKEETVENAAKEEVESEEGEPVAATDITRVQGHLLLRYLIKTQYVPGPATDLVFLESPGSVFGLPSALAETVEAAALDGRVDDAIGAIKDLDEDQQRAALLLLARHIRESLPGVEGDNAVSTLLGVLGEFRDLDASSVMSELADAINVYRTGYRLRERDLVGALILGLGTPARGGRELVAGVLEQEAFLENEDLGELALQRAEEIAQVHDSRLAEVLAKALVAEELPASLNESLVGWSDARARSILRAAQTAIQQLVKTEGPATPQPAAPAAEEEINNVPQILDSLGALVSAAAEADRSSLLEDLLELGLSIDHQDARAFAAENLANVERIQSLPLGKAVLTHCRRRTLAEWPQWLGPLEAETVIQLTDASSLIGTLLIDLWRKAIDAKSPAEPQDVRAALDVVAPRARALPNEKWEGLLEQVTGSCEQLGADEDSMETWDKTVETAEQFAEVRLIDRRDFAGTSLSRLAQLAAATVPAGAPIERATELIHGWPERLAPYVDASVAEELDESLSASTWVTTNEKALARLRLAASRHKAGDDVASPLGAPDLLSLWKAEPPQGPRERIEEGAGIWLSVFQPDLGDVWTFLESFAFGALSVPVRDGLLEYSARLSAADRSDLVERALVNAPNAFPSDAFLGAARFDESDLERSAALVEASFAKASNNESRQEVFRLWRALKLTDAPVVRRLMESIFLPVIEHGVTSRELALRELHVVGQLPPRDRRRVAQAFEEQTPGDEWPRLVERLGEASFMKRRAFYKGGGWEHL